MQKACHQGFTLIELSIVLVIIGLIVGGVLVGQDLIRAAEINSVMVDMNKFVTAVYTFQGKYDCLPGDCANATTFWGVAGGDGTEDDPACATTIGTGTQTCNGDGNGQILGGYNNSELYRAWQQLANAGLIAGNYTGVRATTGCCASVVGVNVPPSRINGAGYLMYHAGVFAGNGGWFDGDYGNVIWFGQPAQSLSYVDMSAPILTTEDAFRLDKKYDDGTPANGRMRSNKGPCATTTDSTAQYNLTQTGQQCDLLYMIGL